MRGVPGKAIDYKVLKPIAEIPKPTSITPYSRITKALAHAPKGSPVVPLKAANEAEAIALAKRLHTFFTGQGISVRRLPGTNFVFVQPKKLRAPRSPNGRNGRSPNGVKRKKRHR